MSLYLKEDIQAMYEKFFAVVSDYEQRMFIRRNVEMVENINRLVQQQKLLAAVGAGHLAGDSGLIALLRHKGYTVEPVLSTRRKAAVDYRYKALPLPGHMYTDSTHGFKANFPGKPTKMDIMGGVEMQAYVDMGVNAAYIGSGIAVPQDIDIADSVAIRALLLERAKGMGTIVKQRYINQAGVYGAEMLVKAKTDDGHYKVRLFYQNRVIYFFMVWNEDIKELQQEDATDFLNSASFFKPMPKKPNQWSPYENKRYGFSALLPVKPQFIDVLGPSDNATLAASNMAICPDFYTGHYYFITLSKMKRGYFIPNDTAWFNERQETLLQSMDAESIRSVDTLVQGYRARLVNMRINKQGEKGIGSILLVSRTGVLSGFLAIRGGFDKPHSVFNDFFSNITLLPFADDQWSYRRQDSLGLEGWMPERFQSYLEVTDEKEVSADTSKSIYVSYDSSMGYSYDLFMYRLSPYFWANSDSALFAPYENSHLEYGDSLLAVRQVTNGYARSKE
jgi:hypothetical protein